MKKSTKRAFWADIKKQIMNGAFTRKIHACTDGKVTINTRQGWVVLPNDIVMALPLSTRVWLSNQKQQCQFNSAGCFVKTVK